MNGRFVTVVVLAFGVVCLSPLTAQAASPQKKHQVVKRQPAGDYERCAEDCPPPGLSAQPAEVWCVTRAQCTSEDGCGCRLFQRKNGTTSFDYVVEAEIHVPREPGVAYVCWCTKKKEP
jgi:hypothetical protein